MYTHTPHAWLAVHHGDAPLIVSFPHTGTEIPPDIEEQLVSPWLARKDADYWVDVLYAFAQDMGATTIRTSLSRTVIDVNRDPSGASLYPGQTTTGLCPLETFDGEPLYLPGREPDAAAIEQRRLVYFDPYHAALREQIARLRERHGAVVLYDAHSIRSRVPRLFEGELPLSAPTAGRAVTRGCRPRSSRAARSSTCPTWSMAASAADGSLATMASRKTVCTRCKWSWRCAATCASPRIR
jgi:N-formylglutamate amidohydrolase